MNYDGKFRDFMVGWLTLQLNEPEVDPEEIETLYDAVAFAQSDRAALAEIEKVLGEGAHMLWGISEAWYDPMVELAREMIETLRQQARADFGDATKFYLFFLNPLKGGCVPDGFEDNLEREICWMFRVFYESTCGAILEEKGWEPYVVVEPSYEDASQIIVLTHPKWAYERKVFVWQSSYKAWNLRFDSLTELAEELLLIRQAIEQRAAQAIRGYRLVQTITDVMGEAL